MTALLVTVFLASLLGSLHCAGMCGAFAVFAATGEPGQQSQAPQSRLMALYHLGRLVTYLTLGTLAGAAGAALNLGGTLVGLSQLAVALAGLLMIGFGLSLLFRQMGCSLPRWQPPRAWAVAVGNLQRRAMGAAPSGRAFLTGLLTTLLPCGWLYAFVVTAAGTAAPLYGALAMAAFWAGTLPVLLSVTLGVQRLLGLARGRLALPAAMAVVLMGAWTLLGRSGVDAAALLARQETRAAELEPKDVARSAWPTCCLPDVEPAERRPGDE